MPSLPGGGHGCRGPDGGVGLMPAVEQDAVFDPDEAWELAPEVAVRPEPFGALLYHYGSRRLSFVKDPSLASLLGTLSRSASPRQACAEMGVPERSARAYLRALATLAASGMVVRRRVGGPEAENGASVLGGLAPRSQPAQLGPRPLVEQFELGLAAPICLTWELTYACNDACVHCLSSSGRRDPRELTTEEATALIDDFAALRVFYVNVGGGEPTIRRDFLELVEHATARGVGVKFSTNGSRITDAFARRIAASDYVDVQVSLDGATASVNDAIRGEGSFARALGALERLASAGVSDLKISVVVTRHNVGQLDRFRELADRFSARLRLTRLRPSGRGVDVWDSLHLRPFEQRQLYDWLRRAGEGVLTGDSFFHLGAYGAKLPGLNLCGAGRVVCLIDPVGDVYACPFAIHDEFKAGNVLEPGGFGAIWQSSACFAALRSPERAGGCRGCEAAETCRGGCMAAKFFRGLPLDGPDPECVLARPTAPEAAPRRPGTDHSRRLPRRRMVASLCDSSPLSGFRPSEVSVEPVPTRQAFGVGSAKEGG
jgi:mycofactocin radical SAM maturase